ncbi:MAG: hypothetical protein Q9213_002870 [Squamulea squamosa]
MAEDLFDKLIPSAVSSLSLDCLHDEKLPKDPCWWTFQHDSREYEANLGKQISHLYCLCRNTNLDMAAEAMLKWIYHEAEIAHSAVFPYVVLPFLNAYPKVLNDYNIAIIPEIQETFSSLTTKVTERCVGSEPIKPTNWSRDSINCNEPNEICTKFNAFLVDPDKEEESFPEISIVLDAGSALDPEGNNRDWRKEELTLPLRVMESQGQTNWGPGGRQSI